VARSAAASYPPVLFAKRQPRDVTGLGVAALSGGFEAGREPGVATEEVTEGVELAYPKPSSGSRLTD